MKIKNIDINTIQWRNVRSDCKYAKMYEKIRQIGINKAFEITFKTPTKQLSSILHQNFRNQRVNFKLKTKKIDRKGYIWQIGKLKN